MSRIYKISRTSKRGAGFTRLPRLARLAVARGPVPRDRAHAPETVVRDRCSRTAHGEENPFQARSAGDRPPRAFDLREKRTQTKAVFPTEAWRGTSPTVNGGGLDNRSAGALACHTRRRAGFPREHTRQKHLFRSFRSCMSIAPPDEKNTKVF